MSSRFLFLPAVFSAENVRKHVRKVAENVDFSEQEFALLLKTTGEMAAFGKTRENTLRKVPLRKVTFLMSVSTRVLPV